MHWHRTVSALLLTGASLLILPWASQAQTCTPRQWLTNTQGVAKADITVSTVAVTVLGANGSCCQALIYNNSANSVYIAFDTVCSSSTRMTLIIPTFTQFVMPLPIYKGLRIFLAVAAVLVLIGFVLSMIGHPVVVLK